MVHDRQCSPWDNLKFNVDGILETQRKFFGTLYNTYNFFALYANIDGFDHSQERLTVADRPEIDRWIISLLNSLVKKVNTTMDNYEPTRAVRDIEEFVVENLSNWYVRQCRRRFWKGEMNTDKLSAYQTLYECLFTVTKLMSPFAPFFSDQLFRNLDEVAGMEGAESVHLSSIPEPREHEIDHDLEERMEMAQEISSLVHSIRKRKDVMLRIRQPLNKILVPVLSDHQKDQVEKVKDLIMSEVNVKNVEYITEESDVLVRKAKPVFSKLGRRAGKQMGEVKGAIESMSGEDIRALETDGKFELVLSEGVFELSPEEVEIVSQDIPGWKVATNGKATVALDITLTDSLKNEGIAREFVNRIQKFRKESGLEVTDRVNIRISSNESWDNSVKTFLNYICAETLADGIELVPGQAEGFEFEIDGTYGTILIEKQNG